MEKRMQILPKTIHYSSNKEYRQCIRNIFDISESARTCYVDISLNSLEDKDDLEEEDEETTDELNYDTSVMEKGMEEWFLKTESNPLFKDLYLLAAGRMFSIDLRIGQAVICSYDTFHLYYTCIWYFLQEQQENTDITKINEYQTLRKWFS
jgi:hypothetical protein